MKLTGQKPVQLRIESTADYYTFSYSTDGKTFQSLGKMNTYFLSSETLGGFTGVVFGWFAEGEAGTTAIAAVDWLDYVPGAEYVKKSAW